MKFVLISALLILPCAGAAAQTRDSTKTKSPAAVVFNPNSRRNGYETYQSTDQIVGSGPYGMLNTIDHRYEGLRGTPYFLPTWNKGKIEMAGGQSYTEVPIKFDAFRQHLLLLRTWVGNDSIIINAEQVKSFQLRDEVGHSYLFRRFPTAKTDDESLKEGYFMVLYEGKTALLKRVLKRFKQADYKNTYSNDTRYDSFNDAFSYYLLKPDQTLVKVKLTQKALLDALSDQKDALKAFMEQHDLTLKAEADAVSLVKQYDSL
ncbi:hypothetical protein [Spirosoma agri]|uniref:Uncharacterized protein n=1 Tax=Spirosoma agri TaxID=1987381 RepID=A0A6M0IMP8_9BACT|nr:hypothetical protein [Spirosoma agri]NEU69132.1 hypothetical protein [Spirosoma agri]